jgi:SAM-dependent methyltransferase
MSEKPVIYTREYYERLFQVEERHWWCLGMRDIARAALRAELGRERPRRVLDAGCGSGASLLWLEELAQGGRVHGVDLSRDALLFSRSRGRSRLAQASVIQLPFRDESFDLLVSVDVLQHLPRGGGDQAALREAWRVLRPGGLFLLRTNCEAPGRRNRPEFHDFHFYSARELSALFEEAGFVVARRTHANVVVDVAARARAMFGALANGAAGRAQGPGLPEPPPPRSLAHAILYQLMRVEAGFARAGIPLPVGGSLVVVGRKPDLVPIPVVEPAMAAAPTA